MKHSSHHYLPKSCGNYLGKRGKILRLGFTLMEIMHRKALCILGGFHNTLQRMSSLTSQSFLTQLKERFGTKCISLTQGWTVNTNLIYNLFSSIPPIWKSYMRCIKRSSGRTVSASEAVGCFIWDTWWLLSVFWTGIWEEFFFFSCYLYWWIL